MAKPGESSSAESGHGEASTWPGAGAAGIPLCLGPRESKLNPESLLCLPVDQVHCLLAGWRAVKGKKGHLRREDKKKSFSHPRRGWL